MALACWRRHALCAVAGAGSSPAGRRLRRAPCTPHPRRAPPRLQGRLDKFGDAPLNNFGGLATRYDMNATVALAKASARLALAGWGSAGGAGRGSAPPRLARLGRGLPPGGRTDRWGQLARPCQAPPLSGHGGRAHGVRPAGMQGTCRPSSLTPTRNRACPAPPLARCRAGRHVQSGHPGGAGAAGRAQPERRAQRVCRAAGHQAPGGRARGRPGWAGPAPGARGPRGALCGHEAAGRAGERSRSWPPRRAALPACRPATTSTPTRTAPSPPSTASAGPSWTSQGRRA